MQTSEQRNRAGRDRGTRHRADSIRPAFDLHFDQLPLVAILRGITPHEVEAVAAVLVEKGWRLIEIPLNSPDAITSIEKLAARYGTEVTVGSGTTLTVDQVAAVRNAGGRLIVMPHGDPAIITAARGAGMICIPGVATPTEAFAAIRAGADVLKLFPAEQLGPKVLKAWRAVIPESVRLLPVGGVTPESMAAYRQAGGNGFGLGGGLYRAGMTPEDVRARADQYARAWAALNT